MPPTLNIIGAGKVGRVLARQFSAHHVFVVQDVCNRSMESARMACEFIGAGTPLATLAGMRPADLVMLTVPDDQIRAVSAQLQQSGLVGPATIVFHCSGALGSDQLGLQHGAASLHPMRSFANPDAVTESFAGTLCTLEGDHTATRVLGHALRQTGAQVISIAPNQKTVYHAAAVFASNYLVTLIDCALTTMQSAGIDSSDAQALLQPLATETLSNIFRLGSGRALTGPIARGDMATVARHQQALAHSDPETEHLYQALAQATIRMKERNQKKD